MFLLYAEKSRLTVRQRERLTSGAVNAFQCRFAFSDAWEGLKKTAVFRAGDLERSVLLDPDGACVIPWEVLVHPGRGLYAGVYGTLGQQLVLPTVWASCGPVLEGAALGEETQQPPSPGVYEQILSQIPNPIEAITNLELEEMLK